MQSFLNLLQETCRAKLAALALPARAPHFMKAMTPSSPCLLTLLFLLVSACSSPSCTPPTAGAPGNGGQEATKQTSEPIKTSNPSAQSDLTREAKGVDLTRLNEEQKEQFFQLIHTEASACGKAHSLAVSMRDDASCRDSMHVSQFIADALASGFAASDIKGSIDAVVSSLTPRSINIAGSPVYGNERAPVTVVVFADFECPHCRAEAPVLRQTIDQFRGRAKLVFKHFPISGHPRSKEAAIATVAAQRQGKFWEMHDLVFEHPEDLEDDDLRAYARQLGLDIARFTADLKNPEVIAKVEADRKEGEALELKGTPAIYINGREYNQLLFNGTVAGWIEDALRR